MSIRHQDTKSEVSRRLREKTQDQRLANLAVHGAGISPWEADVLVDVVHQVYHSDPEDSVLLPGQIKYVCVGGKESAGKLVRECQMKTVVLTLLDQKEDPGVCYEKGAIGLRRHRIMRLAEEAREQGGLLTQEDLAQILGCDARTVRRDVKSLQRDFGIFVPTRGQVKDIGPGMSHRGVAIRHWLEGMEPLEVARKISHSLGATERYIQHFSRVMYLRRKGFHTLQIALTLGISFGSVNTYLDIYEEFRSKREYQARFDEIDLIGATHFQAEDEKKGAPSRLGSVKRSGKRGGRP